ncbi:unnamed protein product [Tenebrio molitor]|nr:unnamed protein product [Tenebrio molitor]
MQIINEQNVAQFLKKHKVQTRPNAGPGLWLTLLLPLALIISAATQPIISTSTYKLSSIFSVGLICSSLVFLYQISSNKRLKIFNAWLIAACIIVTVLFRICLHRGMAFSIWSAIFSTILYYKLYIFVLEKLPKCFTLGEAAVCTQSYTLLLYFTLVNVFQHVERTPTTVMQMSTLTIQVGLFGISTIIFLTYLCGIRSPTKFYILTGSVFVFTVLLPLEILLKKNALLWILNLFWDDLQTSKVVLYWTVFSLVAIVSVNKRIKEAKKATTAVRKIFHVLTVAVFAPGLVYNCSFLYLASGVIFGIFFLLEVLRILNVPPLGQALQNGLVIFGDEKDTGIIALTPMYLLAGCALPLWIHPAPCDVTNSATFSLLPLLSGLLTIGIGDTAASIVGSRFGKHHWHGSKKTIEGTIACVVSQLLMICFLIILDVLKLPTTKDHVKTVVAIIMTSILEAKTDQVDNLALPFVMYLVLIV